MALHTRMNAKAIISQIMKQANGIGISKSNVRRSSKLKGQNGHAKSTYAHSIKNIQNLRAVTTQYIEFLKARHGQKIMQNINAGSAREWLLLKADEISGGTLNTYISALAKSFDNCSKLGLNVSGKDITDIRKELKKKGINLRKRHYNRAYKDPYKIINNMQLSSLYFISAKLQLEAGLRLDDAINSNKWQINDDNSITILGSKNGLCYSTKKLSDKTIRQLKLAKESGYYAPKNAYVKDLKAAGADKRGTHGLRYNFAQERYEELRKEGMGHIEALAQVSIDMGHSRVEITRHYLVGLYSMGGLA